MTIERMLLTPKIETHTVMWNGEVQERKFICLHDLMENVASVQFGCIDLESLLNILKPYMAKSATTAAAEYHRDLRDAA